MKEKLADLESKIQFVANELVAMRSKIDHVKAKRQATGIYADPLWFGKIKSALMHKGQEHQRLLREAAAIRAEIRNDVKNRAEFGSAFMTVAMQQLPKATFLLIAEEAATVSGVQFVPAEKHG